MSLVAVGQTFIADSDVERIISSQTNPFDDFMEALSSRTPAQKVELYRQMIFRIADTQEQLGEFAKDLFVWGSKNQSLL